MTTSISGRHAPRAAFGSVRKLSSGRWQARVFANGGHQNPTPGITYATKGEAERVVRAYEVDRDRGVAPDLTQTTLADFIEEWWSTKQHTLAPATAQSYRSTLDSCLLRPCTVLEGAKIRDLRPRLIQEWLTQLEQPWVCPETAQSRKPAGPAYRQKALVLLKQILKEAVTDELIHRNPADGVQAAPRGAVRNQRRKHFYLYLDEIRRIIAAAYEEDVSWGVFFEVLACSGMRPGELRALWPEQVYPESRSIHVNASVSDGGATAGRHRLPRTKNGDWRWSLLPQPAMDRLLQHIQRVGAGPRQYIWTSRSGAAMWSSTMEAAWTRACLKAGVEADPSARLQHRHSSPVAYDLRAAFISHLLAAGLPSIEVRDLVGHGDDAVTDMYTVVQRAGAEEKRAITARSEVFPLTREAVIDYLYN